MSSSSEIQALLEAPACPICGSAEVDVIRPAAYPRGATRETLLGAYRSSSDQPLMDRLVRCRGCALVYTSPRIRADIVHASYSEAVDPVFVAQDPFRIATFRRSLSRIAADLGLAADRSRRILDIGCAGGAFVKAAQDLGFTSIGIEPSLWLAERARGEYGIDVRPGTLADHSFPDGSFAIVSMWDVIEHLTDPGRELSAIHRLLSDDGHLIVNWPDYGSFARKILGRKWPFFLNVHLFYFTRETLAALLKRHGFEPRIIRPHTQTLELGYAIERASRVVPPLAPLVRIARMLGVSKWPLRYNVGQSLLVARKVRR